MTDLCDTMRRSFAAIAPKAIPPTWTENEPALGAYRTMRELVEAVRDDMAPDDIATSDVVVGALVGLAPGHPDAAFVLTEALAPLLFRGVPARRTDEFRDAILTDLACTILEAGSVDGLTRLGQRLIRRAYERSRRRVDIERRRLDTEALCDLVPDRTPATSAPEHEALARVECEAVCATILDAVASGQLSERDWDVFRRGSLEPNLGYPRPEISKNIVYRRTSKVRSVVAHAYVPSVGGARVA